MEPLFKSAVVGIVPQPTQVPPVPFRAEDLQRLYADVIRDYPFQQFSFLPGGAGAQLLNVPGDAVVIQPGLVQVQTPVELTPERVREKVVTILRRAFERLTIERFLQCGIKVVAHVPAPGANPDAKVFVSERLMRGAEQAEDLGAGFFGGGVKFRRLAQETRTEENLLVEPFIADNAFVFIDYDIGRGATQQPFADVDAVEGWLDEAFNFVRGPTIALLEG